MKNDKKFMLSMTNAKNPSYFIPKHLRAEKLVEHRKKQSRAKAIKKAEDMFLPLDCLTDPIDGIKSNGCSNRMPSPGSLSLFKRRFNGKLSGISLRNPNLTNSISSQAAQIILVRRMALFGYKNMTLEPSISAKERTKQAAKDFFALSHELLSETGETFPLADKNKCLGVAVVKGNKRVYIAVSEDSEATRDIQLRNQLVDFLQRLNARSDKWRFELVHTPTATEYVLPRTLRMETSRPASSKEIGPRMRCVEVQLMAALNKVRRTIKYNPTDTAMVAFSGTLWANESGLGGAANFGNVKRSTKYIEGPSLEVTLHDNTKGYLDVWAPCEEHCAIYYREMLAIAAADEHLYGPRAEEPIAPLPETIERDMVTMKR
ncbi:MAG: hypothetical protein P1U74_04715 [Legionellaceae bacterium]|nr:hypothetical protein [Legionellaceae bacterium]